MMHHENIHCPRCKKALGFAITTTNASQVKAVAWLECDNCDTVSEVVWKSNTNFDDPAQFKLFEAVKNL